ncbi:MAG: hypothetical protein HY664_06725 [Chloroflexi bacterium]|nr:hypothetical protein [Chloroflexota bacterium]
MGNKKPIFVGVSSGGALLLLYFGILTLSNSWQHAVDTFLSLWPWFLALVSSLSLQMALYWHLRAELKRRSAAGATAAVATGGGISTGSMIACCAHHLADVLPFIGLSALASFLIQYQRSFLSLALISNLVAIAVILEFYQKHGLFLTKNRFLSKMGGYNMSLVRNGAIILALIILPLSFLANSCGSKASSSPQGVNLPAKTDDQKGVTVVVAPLQFKRGETIRLKVSLDTHSGSLDFDLTGLSVLEDDIGNTYLPLAWEGSGSGGHHRSGTLSFPPLKAGASQMRLTLKNISDVPERIFQWSLF